LPGTNGVIFVDDGRPGEIFWMQISESGQQLGEIKAIELGMSVEDPEGITFDGSYLYVAGSQSNPKAGERNALVRILLDSATLTVKKAEAITDLRGFLLENVKELGADGAKRGEDGGLNIEGIAWDPNPEHPRLLLGLRSPLVGGDALVIPIKLRDPNGPFSSSNLQIAPPGAIHLSIGGLGIRDIQYDSRLKSFLIISGAPEHHEKAQFMLWEWSGESVQTDPDAKPREEGPLDSGMKPEGITRVRIGSREFIFIVGDSSSYAKMDYAEGS
jgi:hypothetical protein